MVVGREQGVQMGLDQALQQGAGRQRLAGDGLDLGQRVLQALFHDGGQDVLLGLEVIKPAAGLDAGGGGDIAHRGVFVALGAEQLGRLLDQFGAQAAAFPFLGAPAFLRAGDSEDGGIGHGGVGSWWDNSDILMQGWHEIHKTR
jgi:hypothetical protein